MTIKNKTLLELYASHQGKVSDKWSLYLSEYDRLFNDYRNGSISLLEIGIQNGGSLEIWSSYFPKANHIIGCDINPKCADLTYTDKKIAVVVGDANSEQAYENITKLSNSFDIVIDDGSHSSGDIVKSFIKYFPLLADGGVFVAEDLHCSYWEGYEGGLFAPFSAMSFFKLLTDIINHEHWGVDKKSVELLSSFSQRYQIELDNSLLEQIHSIEFTNSTCVIHKAPRAQNNLGRRFIAGSNEDVIDVYQLHGKYSVAPSQKNNVWSVGDITPYEELPLKKQELEATKLQLTKITDELVDTRNNYNIERENLVKIKNELLINNKSLEAVIKQLDEAKTNLERTTEKLIANNSELYRTRKEVSLLGSRLDYSQDILNTVLVDNYVLPKNNFFTFLSLKNKKERDIIREKKLINKSGLFSPAYYLLNNNDVWKSGMDPLNHFCRHGWEEGRNPSKNFNCKKYLEVNNDVRKAKINPLFHYIKYGKGEGRSILNADQCGSSSLGVKVSKQALAIFDINKRNKYNLSSEQYLHLFSTIFPKEEIQSRAIEFEVFSVKATLTQQHLINWDTERKKDKVKELVSIIIPAYGQADLTDSCLQSILETQAGVEYEIIIINNSQDEADVSSLSKWIKYSKIKVIHNSQNLNFALGCNLGFSRSVGGIAVFLNNDTTVTNNWLINLLEPLSNQNISITQPRLLYPDGKLQCMGLVFSDKSNLAYPLYQNLDITKEVLVKNRLFNVITGACLAVRAEDFSLVNGFDVSFLNGQEDIDFCLKLNSLKNTKAMYVGNSIVYHYEGKSKGRGRFVANNRSSFLKRYSGKITPDDLQHYASDGYMVDAWNLDSDEFKKRGVENYIPALKPIKSIQTNRAPLEINDGFFIDGRLSIDSDNQTILIAAHDVGSEIFGGERSFLDMVSAIDSSIYNIIIIIPNKSNEEYVELLKLHANSIYVVPYRMWNKSGEDKKLIRILESICRINYVDIVYVNTIMCREPLVAAKNLNIKKIIHVRETITKDKILASKIPLGSINEILSEIQLSSDFLITNSLVTFNMFDTQNKEVLYNRINVGDYKDLKNVVRQEKVIFGLISSNIPKKGIFDLVKIARNCKRSIPNAHFLLIGPENTHTKKLKKQISFYKLSNFEIAGYFSSPYKAVSKCNIILSLSHFAESFGRTVGESLAGGRPVIAYNYGAIPELVENAKNGFLATYKETDEVVIHIKYFCENTDEITKMGEFGRGTIEKISSPKRYSAGLNNILNRCLDDQNKQPLNIIKKRKVTIIIPIFNAYNEVINCIDSVINTTAHLDVKIILLNDASTDKRIKEVLNKFKEISNINIISNSKNIGYTRTINIGINTEKDTDIILLNSDTITTFNWVESLNNTAYSKENIGTVTAMSDNAGAFSFPIQGKENPKPDEMQYNNYAEIITKSSRKLPPVEVPTGSGFCLYIKRSLLDEIGLFDEVSFPRGYGEENDFCMRAISAGWKNVIDTKAFVFHIRTASFGSEKEQLIKDGAIKLLEKHPSYMKEVKIAFSSSQMKALRNATQQELDTLKEVSE